MSYSNTPAAQLSICVLYGGVNTLIHTKTPKNTHKMGRNRIAYAIPSLRTANTHGRHRTMSYDDGPAT